MFPDNTRAKGVGVCSGDTDFEPPGIGDEYFMSPLACCLQHYRRDLQELDQHMSIRRTLDTNCTRAEPSLPHFFEIVALDATTGAYEGVSRTRFFGDEEHPKSVKRPSTSTTLSAVIGSPVEHGHETPGALGKTKARRVAKGPAEHPELAKYKNLGPSIIPTITDIICPLQKPGKQVPAPLVCYGHDDKESAEVYMRMRKSTGHMTVQFTSRDGTKGFTHDKIVFDPGPGFDEKWRGQEGVYRSCSSTVPGGISEWKHSLSFGDTGNGRRGLNTQIAYRD